MATEVSHIATGGWARDAQWYFSHIPAAGASHAKLPSLTFSTPHVSAPLFPLFSTNTMPPLAAGVSREYLLHHRVCPRILAADGSLVVATAPDAILPTALDDLAIAYR